jgi:monofunctional biosynthetic peptidoglycan transglycosylase
MFMRIDYWSDPSEPLHHEWRDYDHISDTFKRAVVAAEDGKFLQHHGFDWDGIQYALEKMKIRRSRQWWFHYFATISKKFIFI